jgi:hypothetical protein
VVPARVIENKSVAYGEVRKLLLGGEVHPGVYLRSMRSHISGMAKRVLADVGSR